MKNLTVTFFFASALSLIGACGQEGQENYTLEFTDEASSDEGAIMAMQELALDDGAGCKYFKEKHKDGDYKREDDGSLLQCRDGTWEWLCGPGHPTKECCDG
jgi:hypothetical protein